MSKQQIFGLVGFIGSGKDTVAGMLETEYFFKRTSFASSLKDVLSSMFGWRRELLEGTTPYSRTWREQVDTWWAERLGIPNFTPRYAMQHFGTDVCREHFHKEIWVASLERRVLNSGDNVVVSDCRFSNEIQALRRAGGKIVWVRRDPLPEWYLSACVAMMEEHDEQRRRDRLTTLGVHASELEWLTEDFDHIIYNNGTIEQLRESIKNLVIDLQVSI